MGVRVWGVIDERLIEVRSAPLGSAAGIRIEGLPEGRTRTTADRVRAALVNSGLISGEPSVKICLHPPVAGAGTSDLDLAIGLAVLAEVGRLGSSLRWILGSGRLGLDGTIHASGIEEPATIVTIGTALGASRR